MNTLVKNVFAILATLLVSLLLFTLVLGPTGQNFIWNALQPAFQANWDMDTFQDGRILSTQKNIEFSQAQSISTPDTFSSTGN